MPVISRVARRLHDASEFLERGARKGLVASLLRDVGAAAKRVRIAQEVELAARDARLTAQSRFIDMSAKVDAELDKLKANQF